MPRGIAVNCIDPGPNDTRYADDATRSAVAGRMPGGRWGTPGDAARLVAWLVTDEADWVHWPGHRLGRRVVRGELATLTVGTMAVS